MKQRQVQDDNNTIWQCVQAFSGMSSDAAKKAEELLDNPSEQVPVICTPSGGAQSVRLQLNKNWIDDMNDDALLNAISAESSMKT
jgi:hypothetical protein